MGPTEPLTETTTIVRNVDHSASAVWRTAVDVVERLGLQVEDASHDGWGGRLSSRRADGHPADVDVASLDPGHSQVTVRVLETDRDLAWLIQQEMLIALSRPESFGASFEGDWIAKTFPATVRQSVDACLAVCEQHHLSGIRRGQNGDWTVVDAVTPESVAVRFEMKDIGVRTLVIFRAGSNRGGKHADLARNLGAWFAEQLP
jgi:hypothetical protein